MPARGGRDNYYQIITLYRGGSGCVRMALAGTGCADGDTGDRA